MLLKVKIKDDKARWFMLHSISNMLVVSLTIDDVVSLTTSPITNVIDNANTSEHAAVFVLCLHIYHVFAYRINRMDVIHHGVMTIILVLAIFLDNPFYYTLCNFNLFFSCGLPGGIDYILMFLVQINKLESIMEKRLNTHINTWLRAPGILYGAIMCHQHWLLTGTDTFGHMLSTLILVWNAQFFSRLVSISYGSNLNSGV